MVGPVQELVHLNVDIPQTNEKLIFLVRKAGLETEEFTLKASAVDKRGLIIL